MLKKMLSAALLIIVMVRCSFFNQKEEELGIGYKEIVGSWKLIERWKPTETGSVVEKINNRSEQLITFTKEGRVASIGKETEYYRGIQFYRVDTTSSSAKIGFIISSSYRIPFYQGFKLKKDTLTLIPPCEKRCDLVFIKVL